MKNKKCNTEVKVKNLIEVLTIKRLFLQDSQNVKIAGVSGKKTNGCVV